MENNKKPIKTTLIGLWMDKKEATTEDVHNLTDELTKFIESRGWKLTSHHDHTPDITIWY